jgi:hypothetical protein
MRLRNKHSHSTFPNQGRKRRFGDGAGQLQTFGNNRPFIPLIVCVCERGGCATAAATRWCARSRAGASCRAANGATRCGTTATCRGSGGATYRGAPGDASHRGPRPAFRCTTSRRRAGAAHCSTAARGCTALCCRPTRRCTSRSAAHRRRAASDGIAAHGSTCRSTTDRFTTCCRASWRAQSRPRANARAGTQQAGATGSHRGRTEGEYRTRSTRCRAKRARPRAGKPSANASRPATPATSG